MRFYRCMKCGKIIAVIKETQVPTICCGEEMKEITANTMDAAQEKHVPVYEKNGNNIVVKVGSVEHPMMPEHYIEWILIETKQGYQRKLLKPNQAPKAEFALCDGDELVAVYAHCNLHGLWKK